MNTLLKIGIGAMALLADGHVLAQDGNMMNGQMWRPGGYWVPILLVAGVVVLIVWAVKQKVK